MTVNLIVRNINYFFKFIVLFLVKWSEVEIMYDS
ncbi:hypothetical protein SAMN05444372_11614 [Flavobacterium micromati]|uniref:Uncharacterized protein n=1 Tax=Flavobacterium micromati TaxID=229205 RepID=A0A1M5QEF3_9FLAO|nr:hypothetical protein SAMN05444372_11614 [Flavobacterium micromati]